MIFRELISFAINAIFMNKTRLLLTMLSIIIGVASIIALQSFLEGLNINFIKEFSKISPQTFVLRKFSFGLNDLSELKNRKDITISHFREIEKRSKLAKNISATTYNFGSIIRYEKNETNPNVVLLGASGKWQETNGHYVQDGRFFSEFDIEHHRNVCVLGLTIINKLFCFENPLYKEVRIDGHRFTIIGIFEKKGVSWGQNQDNLAMIPITTSEKLFGNKNSLEISIQAKSPELLDDTIDEITTIMRIEHRLKPGEANDFDIITRDSLMKTWKKISTTIFIATIGIGIISLFVSGIGVMNIMLVAVTERRFEIGIKKAVGARRKDILWQFLIEAIIVCEIGCLIGVILGIIVGFLGAQIISMPISVPTSSIIIGFVFISLIGLFSGLYPAYKAATLSPINALQFE